ncbi:MULTISPECIES: S1C family serine protease [unclassified Rummeliibacillus]|uniref:S1C family serine protease n=1 Tax=unclassified Rummeliibacillus TaxID=2622809 RepID=UPI000E65F268|nr:MULTISPECIES: trypsin-like peptidase domain-containing protein [unclassified Rummeliibacillus]RIJ63455.1 PDZ domain-containing protein [Rummeliibacillus sp. POC4]RPJ94918.1 PDZ domain-containing protein [Rummeliibacillus sp. TYF005]
MGYYDNDETRSNRKGGSKAGYFFSGIIGVIVGALLVWLLLPSMVGYLPGGTESSTTTTTNKTSTPQVSTEVSTNVTDAVDKTKDAVVGITNIQETQMDLWGSIPFRDGTNGKSGDNEQEAGSGSGVIYKKVGNKAYIVTNNHVVEGANQLEVTLSDGSKEQAKLVGTDIWTDLAVISISSKKVKTIATFGDSDKLKQGESVIAIGNPLGMDFYGSVTTGVISGKDRTVPVDLNEDGTEDWQAEVLQTDAAINPGNSGGALVNLAGQVIGINSMKISESTVEGLGFSIPINTAIPVIDELQQKGKVERPSMGVALIDLTDVPEYHQRQTLKLPEEVTSGIVVSEVVKNSPASKAGLKKYDVIVEMDGEKVDNSIALRKILYNKKNVGDQVKIKAYRNGEIIQKTLTLADSSKTQ